MSCCRIQKNRVENPIEAGILTGKKKAKNDNDGHLSHSSCSCGGNNQE
jgi:hypothetical protein